MYLCVSVSLWLDIAQDKFTTEAQIRRVTELLSNDITGWNACLQGM